MGRFNNRASDPSTADPCQLVDPGGRIARQMIKPSRHRPKSPIARSQSWDVQVWRLCRSAAEGTPDSFVIACPIVDNSA